MPSLSKANVVTSSSSAPCLRLMYRFVTVKALSTLVIGTRQWPAPAMGQKIGGLLVAPASLRICPELKKPHRPTTQVNNGSFHLSMPDDRSQRPGIVPGRGAGGQYRNL